MNNRWERRQELIDQFEEMLNESNEEIHIGTLTYQASEVLKKTDPIAYREAYLEWLDSEGIDEDSYIEGESDE
jgi:hypothetical protein